MAQVCLNLLWFGSALNRQRAAGVSEHVGGYDARQTGPVGVFLDDEIDRLIAERLSVGLIPRKADKRLQLRLVPAGQECLSVEAKVMGNNGLYLDILGNPLLVSGNFKTVNAPSLERSSHEILAASERRNPP